MNIAVTGYAHPWGAGRMYGAERVIWYMIQEYLKMGHKVVVFSVPGTNVPGCSLIEMPPIWSDTTDIYYKEVTACEQRMRTKFDMVHSYMASGEIHVSAWLTRPWCLGSFFQAPPTVINMCPERIVACSKLLDSRNGGKSKIIYYGLPESNYSEPPVKSEDYLVWLGRIDSGKAPDLAIETAKRAGKRLIIMGHSYHYPFFVDHIWPYIDNDKVIWLRGVNDDVKRRVLRKAAGFLSTNWNSYHELFGLVNIEALACGCPLIGWCNKFEPSSINYQGGEIIENGKQGFINEYRAYSPDERENSIAHAVQFVNSLDQIDRNECYKLFKTRFTAKIMADEHLKFYKQLGA